ncbi:DNA ligase [Ruminococcus sp. 5_1_39BFAA]|uniref:ATP-dependent DNA ligase n=1 Tax=Ruminococcus sp. 5_1_39BFAA TaxID=457412 RepID=UPI003569B48C
MDLFDTRGASPMLIAQQMDAFDDSDWIYELKMDGFRCLSYIDQTMVDFRNKRNMRMLSKFPELKDIYKNVKGRCILDGEIAVLVNGVPDFYRLQKRTMLTDRFKIELEAARYPASYVVFDCIYREGQEFIWEPLMERKEQLSQLVVESPRIAVSRFVEGQGRALYQAAEARELEGVVAKRKDSPYLMGKRTKDWVKFKRMADEDYVVAGYIQKGRYTFSLIIGKYKGDMLLYKGHVTSGVTKEVVSLLEVTRVNPFRILPSENKDAIWVKLNYVCTVEFMPNLQNSLRQPVFKGIREDILPKEVQV